MVSSRALSATLMAIALPSCGLGFELQPYELPGDQGYRHMTAFVNEAKQELVLYGGLGNGGPFPPTPMNYNVYTLDLSQDPVDRQWEVRSTHTVDDTIVARPWFTSTSGFVEVGGNYYLACDDTDDDAVYSFDPDTYEFEHLSSSPFATELKGGDCCAVGVQVGHGRGNNGADARIYIVGGRNGVHDRISTVRYYSITHDSWHLAADLNVARSHLGCASAKSHGKPTIYAIGGGNGPAGVALRSMEVYDVARNRWTLHEDFLPQGRTRIGVRNFKDRYLVLVGGDSTCAGGGAVNNCAPDTPITAVDAVDIKRGNSFVSGLERGFPQLLDPRQTPATAIHETHGPFELYVIAGRTRDAQGLGVLTTTEVLSIDRDDGR